MSYSLALPYPISANLYWRTAVRAGRVHTYVSAEATAYKRTVQSICRQSGITKPIAGRVKITFTLHPALPQNWHKRAEQNPETWDNTVRCIDLDNAQKVLFDALKNVAFEDDLMVWEISAKRGKPLESAALFVMIESILLR